MNLLAPAALGLAAVALPIVAMYILKMRRPARMVPSTFLWERTLRDMQANAPWQRLRPNLLLLLQLLAVAVLVLALARPYVLRAALAQGDVVVVLDGSTLMTATDVAPSRFAAATARVSALIDGLGPNDVMSIILMARHADVLIAQSADRAALHTALDRAAPTLEAPDAGAALSVAAALARGGRHADLFVYVAAGAPAITIPADLPATLHMVTLGGKLRDLGIVAFAASRSPDGTVATLARVVNLGRRFATNDLQLDIATGDPGALKWHTQVDLHPLALAPGGSAVVVRTRLPSDTLVVRAHLTAGDDLAADDWAWATVATQALRRVLLVAPNDLPFLQLALGLIPRVTVDVVAPDQYTVARAHGADLVVFDSMLPARLPPTSILAVGPPSDPHSPLGLVVERSITATGLQAGDDPFGLLRFAGIGQVSVNYATPLSVPPWAYAVLRTQGQPVLVAGQNGAQRVAVFGFGVYNSTWPMQVGFPILVHNLLDWLAPPTVGPTGTYRPGDAVSLAGAPGLSALTVIDPLGHAVRVAPPFPVPPFVATSRPGLYTVEQTTPRGVRRALFAVNLFPIPQGTGTATIGAPSGTGNPATARISKAEVPVELAPLVAALALIVLAGEWWVAARRR